MSGTQLRPAVPPASTGSGRHDRPRLALPCCYRRAAQERYQRLGALAGRAAGVSQGSVLASGVGRWREPFFGYSFCSARTRAHASRLSHYIGRLTTRIVHEAQKQPRPCSVCQILLLLGQLVVHTYASKLVKTTHFSILTGGFAMSAQQLGLSTHGPTAEYPNLPPSHP